MNTKSYCLKFKLGSGLMKKAVIYLRKSSNVSGAQENSIDGQRNEIHKFCKKKNIEIVKEFIDDGVSGTSDLSDREGLQELFNFLEVTPDIDLFIVRKKDRLARKVKLLYYFQYLIEACDVQFLTATKTENKNAEHPILEALDAAYGEMELAIFKDRIKKGKENKKAKGGFLGGIAPIGYYSIRGSKKLFIEESEAVIVRIIFDLRAKGFTMQKICDYLMENGFELRGQQIFRPNLVSRVLNREDLYRGNLETPGILSSEGQEKVF